MHSPTAQCESDGKKKSLSLNLRCLASLFPIFYWLPSYNWEWFKRDMLAGITVSILGVPQCLAYAILAGLPPEWGLYASVIPIAMYVIWGTSTQIALGTVATTAIMIATAVESVMINRGIPDNDPGYEELYQSLVITLAFACGIVRIVFGLVRAGFIVVFLSRPVMTGFIFSVALIILINQFRSLLGLDIHRYPVFYQTLVAVLTNLSTINWWNTLISSISLFILFLPKWITMPRWVPMPLIVIVAFSVISYFLDLQSKVKIIGNDVVPGLPSLKAPNFEYIGDVWHGAVIIAIVSYMGSIALAKEFEQKVNEQWKKEMAEYNEWLENDGDEAIENEEDNISDDEVEMDEDHDLEQGVGSPTSDAKLPQKASVDKKSKKGKVSTQKPPEKPLPLAPIVVDPNMELIAYGMANMLGCFFSGMIVSGSFSRSALKWEMGAATQVASGIQAFICLMCLLFLMPLLAPLPTCVLAAVVTISVYRLIRNGIKEFRFLLRVSRIELIEYLVAVLVPLFVGLELGILISIGTSVVVNLLRHTFSTITTLGKLVSSTSDQVEYVDFECYDDATEVPHITILEMRAELGFVNNNRLVDKLRELLLDGNRYLVVSLNLTSFIDTTSIRNIVTLFEDSKGSFICLAHCRPRVAALIERFERDEGEFPSNIKRFVSTHDAVQYLNTIRRDLGDDDGAHSHKGSPKKIKIVYHGKEEKEFGGMKVPEYSMTNTNTVGVSQNGTTLELAGLAEAEDAETSDGSSVTSEPSITTQSKHTVASTPLQPKFQILGSFSPEADSDVDVEFNKGGITPSGSRLTTPKFSTPRIRKV